MTSKTDRKNQTIQYVYDAMNRLTTKIYPDSTSANYIYDLVSKIRQVTDPTGVYGFAYDNMGRLIGTTTQYSFLPAYTFQNAYGYDAASNRTAMVAPDGSTNSYGYDTLNRNPVPSRGRCQQAAPPPVCQPPIGSLLPLGV